MSESTHMVRDFHAERDVWDKIKRATGRRNFFAEECVYQLVNAVAAHDDGKVREHNEAMAKARAAAIEVRDCDRALETLSAKVPAQVNAPSIGAGV